MCSSETLMEWCLCVYFYLWVSVCMYVCVVSRTARAQMNTCGMHTHTHSHNALFQSKKRNSWEALYCRHVINLHIKIRTSRIILFWTQYCNFFHQTQMIRSWWWRTKNNNKNNSNSSRLTLNKQFIQYSSSFNVEGNRKGIYMTPFFLKPERPPQ